MAVFATFNCRSTNFSTPVIAAPDNSTAVSTFVFAISAICSFTFFIVSAPLGLKMIMVLSVALHQMLGSGTPENGPKSSLFGI
jgi:hypothetical protein